MEQETLHHLRRAARRLTAERDLDRALASAVSVARELTGARYGALAILDPAGLAIARLVTDASDSESIDIEAATEATRGLREEVLSCPFPIRREAASESSDNDPAALPGPSGRSVLAVQIIIDRRPWGYMHLADAAEFTHEDEQGVLVLSALVSTAIAHWVLVDHLPSRPEAAQRELRRAEAITAMARVLGSDARLEEVVDLIAEEGQQFVGTRAFVVFLPIGDELEAVAAGAPAAPDSGFSLPLHGTLVDPVVRELLATYLRGDPRPDEAGLRRWIGARSGLLVPLVFRGEAVGAVAAFDPLSGVAFGPEDERLLRSFAEPAAAAIVTARFVQAERGERDGAEQVRAGTRLARELHDETLQTLGLLRLSLASALHGGTNETLASAVEAAIAQLDHEIDELHTLIEELRPAALQALGLEGALRALVDHAAAVGAFEVEVDIRLGAETAQLPAEVEHAVYRTAQEALTNIVKHADASHVELDLHGDGDEVELRIADDGRGIGARPGRIGFGLLAMRERVEAAGGHFNLTTSAAEGTTVQAAFADVRAPRPAEGQTAPGRPLRAPHERS